MTRPQRAIPLKKSVLAQILISGVKERFKQLLLVLWKTLLTCWGGVRDHDKVKKLARDIAGLPSFTEASSEIYPSLISPSPKLSLQPRLNPPPLTSTNFGTKPPSSTPHSSLPLSLHHASLILPSATSPNLPSWPAVSRKHIRLFLFDTITTMKKRSQHYRLPLKADILSNKACRANSSRIRIRIKVGSGRTHSLLLLLPLHLRRLSPRSSNTKPIRRVLSCSRSRKFSLERTAG